MLYLTEQLRTCEQKAVTDLSLSENDLMERAGACAFATMQQVFQKVNNVAVFCGGGNNAGDGYVLARLANAAGYNVTIYQYIPIDKLPPAGNHAAIAAINAGVRITKFCKKIEGELIVDALLGIGLNGKIREPILSATKLINQSKLPVLALDIPTGLNADTGEAQESCIKATHTTTFIAPTVGMYTANGPDYCGEITSHSLELDNLLTTLEPAVKIISNLPLLPKRLKNSHKNDYGHVLIIGGNNGMPGSVCLAAFAAFKMGAGLVTIATLPKYANSSVPNLPEAMIYGVSNAKELAPLVEKASVIIIGPGLGTNKWARTMYKQATQAICPIVIDASALNLLATLPRKHSNWILTPHAGEAATLLNSNSQDIQKDRILAIKSLKKKYGGVILLKGVGSLVIDEEIYLCAAGNPGMATAGMGDALNGIIAALIAQKLSLIDATKLGTFIHAKAGDKAIKKCGERALLASDLINEL